ncbi:MAG: three-Cys-motif partner protein TcmP [bacterium]|nr:three-Cys-motif partner protein TcmP [bacterium]
MRNCKEKNCRLENGNCLFPGSDGLLVQCVGPWVEEKYFFLERYLEATSEARRKFLNLGNAVYIDLFSGPGRCIIKDEQREIDGGCIRALNPKGVPFNEYHFMDIEKNNIDALIKRIDTHYNIKAYIGDSNQNINVLIQSLSQTRYNRYHFTFIDPFGPGALKFNTIKQLAQFKRMDMLIHFPTGAIKRNLDIWQEHEKAILDDFLGTDRWRRALVNQPQNRISSILIDIFIEQLKNIGYPDNGLKLAVTDSEEYSGVPVVSIKNTKEVELYVLILASKAPLAQKIWQSVIKASPDGQKSLF